MSSTQNRIEHVSLWHPWTDNPGKHHSLQLYSKLPHLESVGELIETVAREQQYCFVHDIMDAHEIQHSNELLMHDKTQAFISKTGSIVALKVRHGRKSGYLIPGSMWGDKGKPKERLLKNVSALFTIFGYEALTPASLSEKVLRSTLPDYTGISRPNDMLRRILLDNSYGGRIDKAIREFYPILYEYDMVKAYLTRSVSVPSPFESPVYFNHGNTTCDRHRWHDFACSFLHCNLTINGTGIHPIQIQDGTGDMQTPEPGENIDRWLWNRELQDCLEKGYTLHHIYEGYGWTQLSGFMVEWSDILWDRYQEYQDQPYGEIIKTMMVGLPGRFLKSPIQYTLIHESEEKDGDIPILLKFGQEDAQIISPWYIRGEYDRQSAQLTPIGSYIVMQCRQDLYRAQLEETAKGNKVIRSYIDGYATLYPTKTPAMLGSDRGQWKAKTYTDVFADGNSIIPLDIEQMKAPGITGKERKKHHATYHQNKNGEAILLEPCTTESS